MSLVFTLVLRCSFPGLYSWYATGVCKFFTTYQKIDKHLQGPSRGAALLSPATPLNWIV